MVSPLPFDEAIAWAVARGVVLPDVYYGDLQGLAQAMSFSIAGLAQLEQLVAIKEALDQALRDGSSFAEWKKNALAESDLLAALPAWRIENIYRTNMQGAYGRGRCEQQRKNYKTRPWLMYDAVNDSRTRPAHAAMDGFVARYDDPVWNTWRPPCGYQCRCRLIALSEKQSAKYRAADEKRMQDKDYHDTRMKSLTEGPDKGWDYNICSDPTHGVDAAAAKAKDNPLGVEVPEPPRAA